MRIGFSVEDFGHEGFLKGLRQRWCPDAEMIKDKVRGRSGISVRRDTPKVCEELRAKGADVVVILTDANDRRWQDVLAEEKKRVPPEFGHCVLCGVAARNVECWLVLDRSHAAKQMGIRDCQLDLVDPKPVVRRALGITTYDQRIDEIATIVGGMPLGSVLRRADEAARSLKALYEDALDFAQQHRCAGFPNELQAS